MLKLDLSNAYRIVPVHPDDQPLLATNWNGDTFLDRALPFGLRSAPKIFNAVADMITWVLHCEGVRYILHYLDDFLILGPPGSTTAASMRPLVETTLTRVGVPIAHHKTEGPTTVITFLGIQIDSNTFQLSLPLEKIQRLQDLLRQWTRRRSCTKKELQSLLGHLSHAATVIRPGRIFLRNLFSLLSHVQNPCHFVRLNVASRSDLAWWKCLLHHWNGRSFFPPVSPSCHIYSDASGSFGCGAYSAELSSWFQLQWPQAWVGTGIAPKELVPIVLAAALWGPGWSGGHVCFHCDNDAVVTVIKRRHAQHPLLTELLRCLFFYASIFHFHFSASHIAGIHNTVADAISRNHLTLLSSLIPQATQAFIPPTVSQFLLALPEWGSRNWTEQFIRSLPRASLRRHPIATCQASAATYLSAPCSTNLPSH